MIAPFRYGYFYPLKHKFGPGDIGACGGTAPVAAAPGTVPMLPGLILDIGFDDLAGNRLHCN
jgi:hypothetical protein